MDFINYYFLPFPTFDLHFQKLSKKRNVSNKIERLMKGKDMENESMQEI